MLIIAAFAFWIVPEKSFLFIGICILVGLIALAMMRYLPPKEEEAPYKERPILKGIFLTIYLGGTIGLLVYMLITS